VLNDQNSYLRMIAYRHRIVDTAITLQAGLFGVWIPAEKKIVYSKYFRSALASTQPPVQWIPGSLPE